MICALALVLAVVLRIAGPFAPPLRGPGELMLRRHIAARLDDRSWRESVAPEAQWIRSVYPRLYQSTWPRRLPPARPYAVWPTYMGQPHRVPGATLVGAR